MHTMRTLLMVCCILVISACASTPKVSQYAACATGTGECKVEPINHPKYY